MFVYQVGVISRVAETVCCQLLTYRLTHAKCTVFTSLWHVVVHVGSNYPHVTLITNVLV